MLFNVILDFLGYHAALRDQETTVVTKNIFQIHARVNYSRFHVLRFSS